LNESKRKITSRRSIQKSVASATVEELRERIKARDEKEKREKLRKAKKKFSATINQDKKELVTQVIQARKNEKSRL
jgi:hypothetical protein